MSFFLLGKTPDGKLVLLSQDVFDSRQEALSELSRLTAAPDFDSWDAEVLVADVNAGTPVLLVRPAAATAPEVLPEADETPEAPVTEEPSPEEDAALAAVMQDLEDEAPSEPKDAEPAEGPEAAPAEDAFVAEAEDVPVVEVDDAWGAAVEQTGEADRSLKGALLRTAAQMEAQGISAPASVGPAETAPADDQPTDDIDSLLADTASEAAELTETPEAAEEDAADDSAGAPTDEAAPDEQPEAPTEEPELESAEGSDDLQVDSEQGSAETADDAEQAEIVEEDSEQPQPEDTTEEIPAVWPWDAAPEVAASPLDGLEEPGLDTESMIRALADDEASRTVVLGEYEAPLAVPVEPELIVSAAAIAEAAAAEAEAAATVAEVETEADTADVSLDDIIEPPAGPSASNEMPEPVSDFIDLGEVPPAPTKAYEPGQPDIDGMTCDDCVYVDTCPNKDERDPATCGSFQWK